MIAKIVILLALFHAGKACKNIRNSQIFRIQNNDNQDYLSACYGGERESPTCAETAKAGTGSKKEQIWEINIMGYNSTVNRTQFVVRSLKYIFNTVTFERKFCNYTKLDYTSTIIYQPEAVDENETLWYLTKREGKGGRYNFPNCLTQVNGKVEHKRCNKEEGQQWKIIPTSIANW